MDRQLTEFLMEIKDDTAVQERLHGAVDEADFVQAVVDIARDRGRKLDAQGIKRYLASRRSELSDDELRNVVGGFVIGGQTGEGFGGLTPTPNTQGCPNAYTNAVMFPDVCDYY